MRDQDNYLAHPVDVYKLVKRMVSDWPEVHQLAQTNPDSIKEFNNFLLNFNLINTFSLTDAINGIINLIHIYKLNVQSLANGLIEYYNQFNEIKIFSQSDGSDSLNTFDCFKIGRQCYDNSHYLLAIQWLKEALMRANIEDNVSDQLKQDILKYLSFSYYKIKDYEEAIDYMEELMQLNKDPDDNQLNELSLELMNLSNDYEDDGTQEVTQQVWDTNAMMHQELCGGVKRLDDWTQSQLKCYHLNTTLIPYLRLTRVKVEEQFKSPNIVVIHQFLSDTEIELMTQLATPWLHRTSVVDTYTGAYIPSKDRLADGHFVKDSEHPVMATISRRVSAITGLDLTTAEDYNVIRYGVGGYYGHHYDTFYYVPGGPESGPERIATWINYLSDVEAGGATVFPNINVTVWPKRGSALLWFNKYKSDWIDIRTMHGGCPVLVGVKWIATKWIRPSGQEFRKPCVLPWNASHSLQDYYQSVL